MARIALLAALATLLFACCATAVSAKTSSAAAHRSILWGASVAADSGGIFPPYETSTEDAFAHSVGKVPSLIPFNIPFEQCFNGGSNCAPTEHCVNRNPDCTPYRFPLQGMDDARRYGAIPLLNWGSETDPFYASTPGLEAQPEFQLSNLVGGQYDSYIRQFAQDAKAWGHPFLLRYDWEMNGNWFPWGAGINHNSPALEIQAWRHVHQIFTAVGVTNAKWVWCPYVDSYLTQIPLKRFYPGGAYVDWTCLDGYNWPISSHRALGYQSFGKIFDGTYKTSSGARLAGAYTQLLRLAPRKPVMLGEVASSADGGNKAAWIANMFSAIRTRFTKIRALVYNDDNAAAAGGPGFDWSVSGNAYAKPFAKGVSSRAYRSNQFSSATGASLS